MTALVSLFRGINVGGHHKVKMDGLKKLHESLGLRDVVAYLQTGNVVFKSEDADVAELTGQIIEAFEKTFGFRSEVILRTSTELSDIVDKNPFLGHPSHPEKEWKWVVVMFLAALPDDKAKQELLKTYVGSEELHIIDKELYIYYSNGVGRSKLSGAFIENKLKVRGTARNWNTVTKLLEMAQR